MNKKQIMLLLVLSFSCAGVYAAEGSGELLSPPALRDTEKIIMDLLACENDPPMTEVEKAQAADVIRALVKLKEGS